MNHSDLYQAKEYSTSAQPDNVVLYRGVKATERREVVQGIKSYIQQNKTFIPCTCGKKALFMNKATKTVSSTCRNWNCPQGQYQQRRYWAQRANLGNFDYFLTVTTKFPFTAYAPVKQATEAKNRFLAAIRHKYPGVDYIWAIGMTNTRKFIHYHLLLKGPLPTVKRIRALWHKLSGCYQVKLRRAEKSDIYYLLNNASNITDASKDDRFSGMETYKLSGLRRIGSSRKLFPKRVKTTSSPYKYVGLYLDDNQLN